MRYLPRSQLNRLQRRLLGAATRAAGHGYAPYSRFHVGAALIDGSGRIITGVNVENAAYGSTICAERSALLRARSRGVRRIDAIAVTARGPDPVRHPVTPCGACRQVLLEAATWSGVRRPLRLWLAGADSHHVLEASIEELLPLGFLTLPPSEP